MMNHFFLLTSQTYHQKKERCTQFNHGSIFLLDGCRSYCMDCSLVEPIRTWTDDRNLSLISESKSNFF
jgi:hypothetical protein